MPPKLPGNLALMSPDEITRTMLVSDHFSQWLGVEVLEIKEGYCKLKLTVRKDMLNGFGIAHGGITYSLADSALAFASNSRGQKSVSIETSISHTQSLREHDLIIAEAIEEHSSNKIAIYSVKVFKEADKSVVGLFKGSVYRTDKIW